MITSSRSLSTLNRNKGKYGHYAKHSMKRIEAVIPPETVSLVTDALMNVGVGGVTVLHGRGKSGDPKLQLLTLQSRETLLTVVNDSIVDKVLDLSLIHI